VHLAEHLRDGWGHTVAADTIERAARIGDYYAAHALAAFDDMGADAATRNARQVVTWIERTNTSAYTKRELFRAVTSAQLKTMADLDPVLAVLEVHGYLRQLDPLAPKRGGGRPPSPSFLVHPEVHRPAATVHPIAARRAS
jgi:replicative DNA helicase